MKRPHTAPLARQVVALLHCLRTLTGNEHFLFTSLYSASRLISDMGRLNALRRMGYAKGIMTIHEFRSMASTLLYEQGYNRDWIERQPTCSIALRTGASKKTVCHFSWLSAKPELVDTTILCRASTAKDRR
ncbi:MAG: hypothetical protein QM579_13620 [Desulfovibrio sp.]|uniref:tyrosine-type recombinase/integrase n=1 Tax=Desulfovibrio sp. TaxID=885 RepID=UPI0039E5ACFC